MTKAFTDYLRATQNTPQTEQAKPTQVRNNAGGFTFKVSDKDRLERFLILGTTGGTYYVGEHKLTKDNAEFVRDMLKLDWKMVVDATVDVSVNGRAYRNSPAIFVISLALHEVAPEDKGYVRQAFSQVVRTSTHLFEAAEYIDNLGGWGRAKRKAFAEWYEEKDADELAYQVVKYRQRNGWTHKDVLRLSHAQPPFNIAQFVLGKNDPRVQTAYPGDRLITGFQQMQHAITVPNVLRTLRDFPGLPWETIPTKFLKSPEVWKLLLFQGQLRGQALVRNVSRLNNIGAFNDVKFAGDYAKLLADEEMIVKTRLHPINYANAIGANTLGVYDYRNQGARWGYSYSRTRPQNPLNPKILAALESGFYSSFKAIEPAGKRTLIAIDTSASMTWRGPAGLVGMDAREAAAAMAMVTLRSEPYVDIIGFSSQAKPIQISANADLNTVTRTIDRIQAAATDCSLPMVWARKNNRDYDTFFVYTDNETNIGTLHPFQALKQYRDARGIDARLGVVGFTATDFTIADPTDRGTMDFVGFDANAPRALADFSAGRI